MNFDETVWTMGEILDMNKDILCMYFSTVYAHVMISTL